MSFFDELKRRNVIRVGFAYIIVGWVIAQIAEFAFENFGAPDWVLKSVVVILLLGLPLALIFAWAFEMTPEGLKREADVDRSQSITSQTGQKLNHVIIAILVVAVGWFAFDKFYTNSPATPAEPLAAATVQDKSVAVLPFVAMSSGEDDEYFADGLTEEILNSLAQLPELLVTARTSAFSFKGQDIPIQEIAAALGVKHIVEGSVRRSGERLRVTAQLIRADDGFHLWSRNYDSTSTDTIAVQENIAEQIASVLDVVLDEQKREAMKQAGLRDVEAFTLYQKGLDVYFRAHGEMNTMDGLRQANTYFDKVIKRVPTFAPVYLDHSDLFIHILGDEASGAFEKQYTDEEAENAYAAALADYAAAEQHAPSRAARRMVELDRAYVSGSWRTLGRQIERALDEPGCNQGNWTPIIADTFGYSESFYEHSLEMLTCDPRRSISWFNATRSALRMGDTDKALQLAREGTEIAPGSWLSGALVRALVANDSHEAARKEINDRIQDPIIAALFQNMVAAHEGDQALAEQLFEAYTAEYPNDYYWGLITAAWSGQKEVANRYAAIIDKHHFGAVTLTQIAEWCSCGAPFDLDATPDFAAKLEGSDLPWPPQSPMDFPLKDW
jgi:TolB-like protein